MMIVVAGTGRCGTHSYAAALQSTPLYATHEAFPEARRISNRRWDGDLSYEDARYLVASGLQAFKNFEHWCDCNCLTWNFLDILDDILGDGVAFVWLRRDRGETINSMYRTGFCARGKLPWTERAHRGFYGTDALEYDDEMRLANCAHAYDIRCECIASALAGIPADRRTTVEIGDAGFAEVTDFISRATGLAIGTELPWLNKSN